MNYQFTAVYVISWFLKLILQNYKTCTWGGQIHRFMMYVLIMSKDGHAA